MGPLRGANNRVEYLYIVVQDVTEVVSYEQKLLEINLQDNLTGTHNRRFLEVYLQKEFQRHRRYSRSLSVIMLDIDFFKQINDTYGHQCGDFVIKSVSAEVASAMRKADCLVRYGGDEFCCLLPETHLDNALIIAERIRKIVASKAYIFHETPICVTLRLGAAEMRNEMNCEDILLKIADESLYEAKRTGRNKVFAIQNPV